MCVWGPQKLMSAAPHSNPSSAPCDNWPLDASELDVWTLSPWWGHLLSAQCCPNQRVCLWQSSPQPAHSKMCSLFSRMSFSKTRKCSPVSFMLIYLNLTCSVCTFLRITRSIPLLPLREKYFHVSNQTLWPRLRSTIHVDAQNLIYPLLLKISSSSWLFSCWFVRSITNYWVWKLRAFPPSHLLSELYSPIQ